MAEALEVRICGDITPRNLVVRHQQGQAVFRTAHIGNQYLSNLLLASIGLPLYLYDKTRMVRDTNYHPRFLIREGRPEEIAPAHDLLTPFGVFSDDVPYDGTPAHLHYTTLQKLFGEKLVFTEAELFLKHEKLLTEVLSVVARYAPAQFDRWVFSCGRVARRSNLIHCGHQDHRGPNQKTLVEDAVSLLHTLRGLVKDPDRTTRRGGAIPSLPLTQVLCGLVGWWESGNQEIFELSGPDMVTYAATPSFTEDLRIIFTLISQRRRHIPLPSNLLFQVVPTANFRFGYVETDIRSELPFWLHRMILEIQTLKRELLPTFRNHLEGFKITAAFEYLLDITKLPLENCGGLWMLDYDIRQGTFFSHHDLLPDRKLLVPEAFLDVKFQDMQRLLERLKRAEADILSRNRGAG